MVERGDTAGAAHGRRAVAPLPIEARVRVAAWAVLLMVLPTAVVVWAVGREAERQEREVVDAALTATVRAARSQFDVIVADAGRRAAALARTPAVQQALAGRSRTALARLTRANPGVAFRSGPARPSPPLTVRRAVEVREDDRVVGSVWVDVRLDERLVARLRARSGAAPSGRLALARDGAVVAGPGLDLDDYRVARLPLARGAEVELLALTPAEPVRAAASATRRRMLTAGIATLVAIGLLAYALAPFLLRARLSQRQRTQAAHVLSHLNDGVALVDETGVVRAWNPAAETITGLAAVDVIDRHAGEAIPGWPRIESVVPVAPRPGEPAHAGAVPVEIGGRELWLSVTAAASHEGVVYAFRDLSSERELEGLRSELLATVSHELRTPLASIYGAGMTLRRTDRPVAAAVRVRLLELITEEAESLARIVEEILLASQLADGRLRLRRGRFDARSVARSVLDAALVRAGPMHRLTLSVPESPVEIAGDDDKTHQVLTNLVDNAIKYSPGGGPVEIRVEAGPGSVRYSVRDEGLGIAPRDQSRVFEKFTRLDPQMTRGIGGTGLGLYVCRELVDRMGGRIGVESTVAGGSTFWFELPVANHRGQSPETHS